MFDYLKNLDRRWIFLLMGLAVGVPILTETTFPETPTPMVMDVFKAIDQLPEGSRILLAFDYDPASQGELQPMAAAFTRHCMLKKHRLYFMTLWPQGVPMIQRNMEILVRESDDYKYGVNYVNLGFRPGGEGVIKLITTDLKQMYSNDVAGASLDSIPMTRDLKNIQQMDLLVNVGAGTPGTKEWVQYAATPFGIDMVAGTTGVGAPTLYPYIPQQIKGLLGAIKGAAEYEQAIINAYPEQLRDNNDAKEGLRRMGPQLVAHLLMIFLIILGNVIFFTQKRQGGAW